MTGTDLKVAPQEAKWTQEEIAPRLDLTQRYLSIVERGLRPVRSNLAAEASKVFDLPPTALPLESENSLMMKDDELKFALGALGYPGFSYLQGGQERNSAQVLFYALDRSDLDARVVEALPWLTYTYVKMDWDWLVRNAKIHDRQNRLGFVVSLAETLAQKNQDPERSKCLTAYRALLNRSRLVREDTLCHDSMTKVERKWLKNNRPPEAKHWNLLTDLDVKHLAYFPS